MAMPVAIGAELESEIEDDPALIKKLKADGYKAALAAVNLPYTNEQ